MRSTAVTVSAVQVDLSEYPFLNLRVLLKKVYQ
jgi:hypothetical protein